jgi:hypothetical protein
MFKLLIVILFFCRRWRFVFRPLLPDEGPFKREARC